jgi:uncharacterized membrane protein YebE (DUF533 family)
MILFYGTYPITFSGDTGTFHCPRCGAGKPFEIRNWTRFFHLYWIPLIPYKWGSFLECKGCKATWDEKVRNYDPEAERAAFHAKFESAMLQAMIAMAEADGHIDQKEMQAIAGIMKHLSGVDHSVGEVRAAIAADNSRTLQKVLRGVADDLNDNGKEMVIKSLYCVADADNGVSKEERAKILDAGKILAIKRDRMEALLVELETE